MITESNYYTEVENYIKKNEVNKKARRIDENSDTLNTYWNIGRILVEAQGGEKRARYGNELIKKWSEEFTKKYGKGYSYTNMKYYRQYYILFRKGHTVCDQLSWSNIRLILPIKVENKRNYYINLCIKNNLSARDLQREIKNNSYERLIDKPETIEIISTTPKLNIKSNLKNPIIIELDKGEEIKTEHDLEILLLAKLKSFFSQLGEGFTLVGNQYKIDNYYVDILLFNVNFNCYVVVELKLRELRKEDKGQIEFYMKLVDTKLKKEFHNKTMGIIISKYQDKFIAKFVGSEDIIPITYEVV